MSDVVVAYRELLMCWVRGPDDEEYPFEHGHSSGDCDWGWACSADGCPRRVDFGPCPEHAPTTAPGLRLVECQAEPRHWLWAHDREDYGHSCPWCAYNRAAAELRPLREAAERREHRWCWLFNRCKRLLLRLGLARWERLGSDGACWHVSVRWRWSRC